MLFSRAFAQEDDRAFFEALYRANYRLMYAAAWQHAADPDAVEEIVAESLMALFSHADTLQGLEPAALRGYIITTVRHEAYRHLKSTRRMRERCLCLDDQAMERLPAPGSVAQQLLLQEELAAVIRAMAEMPPKEQAILKMKVFHDMENDDIAQAAGLAKESVRQYLSRARRKLKQLLAKEGEL